MAVTLTEDSSGPDPLLSMVGERFDRLMTIESRPLSGGLPPDFVVPMYEICRRHHGEPLSTLAARSLMSRVAYGDHVIVATGAGVPPKLPQGETDGPPGAAVLARAVALGLGAQVTIVSEEAHSKPVEACAALVGSSAARPINVETIPPHSKYGPKAVEALLARCQPSAIVFIELDGPNADGHFHGVRGDRRPAGTMAHLHLLAAAGRMAKRLTIGIGDGGNEVGFGAVRATLAAFHPNGFVVTTAETDVIVSAAISNWGAYAVCAGLAVGLGSPDLLHGDALEGELIRTCIGAGARDGATASTEPRVDGVLESGHRGFVSLLESIVASSLIEPGRASSPRPLSRDVMP
ncbi:glutamate cyclase domain-containing protein [Bradyrhizobium sp. ORS 111]|uniref:glutamate cyclase domain-containing protein n=1 Tax=Bradyrhizobium sp. ORS 111 TaxID=1685958 RepID=UPI00388EDCD0